MTSIQDILIRFLHPWFLLALPVPFILLWWQLRREKRRPTAVMYSDIGPVIGLPKTLRQRLLFLLPFTRTAALCLGILALARPQYGILERTVNTLGLDIVLAIDISGSMMTPDYNPNRMEAAKRAAIEFVRNRRTDRVGVVVFSASTATLCPPTMDMTAVEMFLEQASPEMLNQNMTAVGEGLLLAVKKLEESTAKSKVIILLTDGENNVMNVMPLQAAEAAKALGIRVYTIGVSANAGRSRRGGLQIQGARPNYNVDEMKKIASMTGGQHFEASDEKSLVNIYAEIDAMEKSDIEVKESADYQEKFFLFWLPGFALIGFEVLLRALWLRRLP